MSSAYLNSLALLLALCTLQLAAGHGLITHPLMRTPNQGCSHCKNAGSEC